ncbi:hypothetical protein UR09_03815 [Candidatus Nitromaritima sp. SCGC AAA799-A02]|nr:hypothetical protein UR09_03815 [Candidatus Nitromaritima sp. SCGC AAA799-A02]KMP12194.1 hypothetical protein UZ36_01920 [Candidatus Nitromaritima sp. SCGC AAA799-C22]
MLAFAKDITHTDPKHPEEDKNSELKEYMDYQRKLNHERIVYHSLDHAKTHLQKCMNEFENEKDKIEDDLKKTFPVAFTCIKNPDTILFMLRKLMNGHNSTNNWYRMNPYYYALVYDSMKLFFEHYNQLLRQSPEKADEYRISEGAEIDFDDWSNLFFPDLDFHAGKDLGYTHYPFAKRNKAIMENLDKEVASGKSREEALQAIKGKHEIDDVSINFLLGREISKQDLELFYTSVENPIYGELYERGEGKWATMDGESIMDQAYYLASNLKVWVWRKKEDAESAMDELANLQKK